MNSKNNEVLMVLELTEKTNCRGIANDYFLWVMFFNGKNMHSLGTVGSRVTDVLCILSWPFELRLIQPIVNRLLNPFKITSSARLTTAEILNDQKQTLRLILK